MKLPGVLLAIVCIISITFGCAHESSEAAHLKGVWKVSKVLDLTDKTETDPGNTHYIITEKHIMTVGGKEDRPVVENNFALMTYDEILSQLPAGGGFMEYEIQGGKIHRNTRFALSEYFEGKLIITEFEVTKDTLVFRDDHHADGHLREWHMTRVE